MTTIPHVNDTATPAVIRHPEWCAAIPDDAPRAGDPVGSPSFYDRLGPAEPDREHRGLSYTVEAGSSLDSVSVAPVAMFDPEEVDSTGRARSLDGGPAVQLSITMRESIGSASAYLSLDDVERLVRHLHAAARVLREADGRV